MPIFLECDRCTACCRWPGQVRLAEGEVERTAVGHHPLDRGPDRLAR